MDKRRYVSAVTTPFLEASSGIAKLSHLSFFLERLLQHGMHLVVAGSIVVEISEEEK